MIKTYFTVFINICSICSCQKNYLYNYTKCVCIKLSIKAGLEKIPISQGLVTLLHIWGVILTPQSPETPRGELITVKYVFVILTETSAAGLIIFLTFFQKYNSFSSKNTEKVPYFSKLSFIFEL